MCHGPGCADVQTAHYGEHIELLAFVRRERNKLVLKRATSMGSGVTLDGKPKSAPGMGN